jgi:death-on-curing protein
MRYLTLAETLDLHTKIIQHSGGASGVRDSGGLESSLAQPQMAFGGRALYPDLITKAAALGFSLVSNHPFIDGNKRIGHAAMEVFLLLNGHELDADVDDSEAIILQLAAGKLTRDSFVAWVREHVQRHQA